MRVQGPPGLPLCRSGGIGRHNGLKIRRPLIAVRVRVPPSVPNINIDMDAKKKYEEVPEWVRRAEFKLDRFNHLMELARTCLGACTLILQIVILLKLFNVI